MEVTQDVIATLDNVVQNLRNNWRQFSNEDIEDLKQDTLVEYLEASGVDDVGGYLNKAFRRNCHDLDRRTKNRQRLEAENASTIAEFNTPTVSKQAAAGDPSLVLEAEQELGRRFAKLSPLLRKVAYLIHAKGMSVERVAKELGTSTAAINMACTRIKQKLEGTNNE